MYQTTSPKTNPKTKDIYIECADRNAFLSYLKQNPGIIIFKFGASWCKPCKKIKDIVENHFAYTSDNVICFDLDIDEYPDVYAYLKSKKQVNGVPSLLAYNKDNITFASDMSHSGSDLNTLEQFFENINIQSTKL